MTVQVVDGTADDLGIVAELPHAGVTAGTEEATNHPSLMVMIDMFGWSYQADSTGSTLALGEHEELLKADSIPSPEAIVTRDERNHIGIIDASPAEWRTHGS